jgi:hypothetical protein
MAEHHTYSLLYGTCSLFTYLVSQGYGFTFRHCGSPKREVGILLHSTSLWMTPYRLLLKVGKNPPLRAAYFREYATLSA